MAHAELDHDQSGMNVHWRGGEVIIGYSTTMIVATAVKAFRAAGDHYARAG